MRRRRASSEFGTLAALVVGVWPAATDCKFGFVPSMTGLVVTILTHRDKREGEVRPISRRA